MVRRAEADNPTSASRCSSPAGASPASVSTGAPRQTPRAPDESSVARVSRALMEGASPRAATSRSLQPARFTTRASSRSCHGEDDVSRTPFRRRTCARARRGRGRSTRTGDVRNTRGPSAQPLSRQRGSYKPTAKASAAQRESEGTTVVTRPATNNAGGAKGPCGGNVGSARTYEGMTGKTGSNHPERPESPDHVRQLQRRLWKRPSGTGPTFPCTARPHLQA